MYLESFVENFTPVSALIGGMLLGISTAMLLFFNGRIAGISGIASGLFVPNKSDWQWRVVFILGMAISGLIYQIILGNISVATIVTDRSTLLIAGLLVGVGATLGSGCTSGHGICGIARFSPRSIVATLIFMSTAMVTVYITT